MRLEPHRLVFLDETGTTTKMTRAFAVAARKDDGFSPRPRSAIGKPKPSSPAYVAKASSRPSYRRADGPAHLRNLRRDPTRRPPCEKGDVVILDNLPAHKSAAAEQAIQGQRRLASLPAALQPRPQPDRNGVLKLKAPLRAMAVRTIDALWSAIGEICDLFSPQECQKLLRRSRIRIQLSVRCSNPTSRIRLWKTRFCGFSRRLSI